MSNLVSGVSLGGSGNEGDPYRVVLSIQRVGRVQVLDADSQPVADANVTVVSSGGGGRFPSKTGSDGKVSFVAVSAGTLTVSASAPLLGVGGRSTAVLQYDDDVIDVVVTLEQRSRRTGLSTAPVPGDADSEDPAVHVPQPGALVTFDYSGQGPCDDDWGRWALPV